MTATTTHAWRYQVGVTYATVHILAQVKMGANQRADRYWVRMLCCGTECEQSHSQIRERIRRPEAKSCRHCFTGPASWTPVVMAVPDQPVWEPGEVLGPVVLLQQESEKSWRIRWVHCGREEVLTRHRLTDLMNKVRRGLNPLCRVCAREAASRRARNLPPPSPVYVPLVAPPAASGQALLDNSSPPPPLTLRKEPYLPDWLIGPERIWPRPPSLPRQPAIWGTQL